MIWQRHPR